jgi:hypothetical protein
MFQILTKKIDDIYEEPKRDNNGNENEIKTKKKKYLNNSEIELKKNLLEINETNEFSNNYNLNIELRVANNPDFRPFIEKKYENKKYFEFIDLMKKCWKQNPNDRPNFNEITMIIKITRNFIQY